MNPAAPLFPPQPGRTASTGEASIATGSERGAVAVWDPDAEREGDIIFAGTRLRPDALVFLLIRVCGHPTVPCAAPTLRSSGLRRSRPDRVPADPLTTPGAV
jgi:hypothetical protein